MLTQTKKSSKFKIGNATIFFVISGILLIGCGKAPEPPAPINSEVTKPQTIETKTVEAPKQKQIYVYQGDKFRDPFIPAGASSNYQPDATFDPKKATLKAIILGTQAQSALLMVGGNSAYFIKGDVIFDVMGKVIPEFKAKVFENKVVLYGEGDTMFEFKIRKTEKGEN